MFLEYFIEFQKIEHLYSYNSVKKSLIGLSEDRHFDSKNYEFVQRSGWKIILLLEQQTAKKWTKIDKIFTYKIKVTQRTKKFAINSILLLNDGKHS